MPSVLKLKFSYRFEDPVWEIKSSSRSLLVNTRNSETLNSQFSLVDISEPVLLWEGLQFEDEWWVSAYAVLGELAVFQKFEDTQDIEARSVFVFHLNDHEVLWSEEDLQIYGLTDETIQIKKGDSDELIHLSLLDGTAYEQKVASKRVDRVNYPLHYEPDNAHFETLARFLKSQVGITLDGSCDYLEYGSLIFIAANHVINSQKTLTLYVFDEKGALLFEELLETGVKGLVSGAFFIAEDALIFVTEKKELKIYSINEKV